MLGLISGKTLSIGGRLRTLGLAAIVGISSMLAVGWYQNHQLDAALHRAIDIQSGLQTVNEMRLANSALVLAAMDTIIDRSDGRISPERLAIITDAAKQLTDGEGTLRQLADDLGNPGLATNYTTDLAIVIKAVQVDLKRLVETGADEEAYAQIDDAIDGAGEKVASLLNDLSVGASKLVQARVSEATGTSGLSLHLQLGLGFVAFFSVLGLQFMHGKAIVSGIQGVRAAMQRIVGGDLDHAVSGTERTDEIGDMARAAEIFRISAV